MAEERRKNILRRQMNNLVKGNNGEISNSKVWAFIGCATATWIMIYMTIKDKMGWEMFVVYIASVAGFSQLSKLIAYKYGGSVTTEYKPKTKTDEGSD
jgi:hypothetical protein